MSRDPNLIHPLDFDPNENLDLTEQLLAFVTEFPEQATDLFRMTFEDMRLEEEMEKLEQERKKMKTKKLSALKALRQLQDYNMKGITELPELPKRLKTKPVVPTFSTPIRKVKSSRSKNSRSKNSRSKSKK